jgi:hypothetical protein
VAGETRGRAAAGSNRALLVMTKSPSLRHAKWAVHGFGAEKNYWSGLSFSRMNLPISRATCLTVFFRSVSFI